MRHNRGSDVALLFLAVACVSTASILVRLAGVHGFAAASWRLMLGALLTMGYVVVAGYYRELRRLKVRELVLMALSGVALALHFDLWMASLWNISIAASVTIVDSYPALMVIAGRILYRERYSPYQILGTALAMGGVAGLSWVSQKPSSVPEGGDPLIGALLAFGGMVAVSVYFIIGRGVRSNVSTPVYTGVVYSVAAMASVAFTLMLGIDLVGYPVESYVYLVLLAVIPMLGGHTVLNYLLGRMELLVVTAPVLGEPVGASILGAILLGEIPTLGQASMMAVTLTGIALVLLGRRLNQRGS